MECKQRQVTRFLSLLPFLFLAVDAFAAPSTVNAQLTPSRVFGKAPLLVFLDATGTTDPDTTHPIHHLSYCFDADSTNQLPAGTGRGQKGQTYSKAGHKTTNADTFCGSPMFAYIYEHPGTYTAKLTVTAEDGDISTVTQQITVTDYADSNTVCINEVGDSIWTGCPGAATKKNIGASGYEDFDNAVESCISGGNKRCVFKAGGSYAANNNVDITASDVYIGSYDSSGIPAATKYTVRGSPSTLFYIREDDIRIVDGDYMGNRGNIFMNVEMTTAGHENVLVSNWDLDVHEDIAPITYIVTVHYSNIIFS